MALPEWGGQQVTLPVDSMDVGLTVIVGVVVHFVGHIASVGVAWQLMLPVWVRYSRSCWCGTAGHAASVGVAQQVMQQCGCGTAGHAASVGVAQQVMLPVRVWHSRSCSNVGVVQQVMLPVSLVPRPHPLRDHEGRSGAPSPNSWIGSSI